MAWLHRRSRVGAISTLVLQRGRSTIGRGIALRVVRLTMPWLHWEKRDWQQGDRPWYGCGGEARWPQRNSGEICHVMAGGRRRALPWHDCAGYVRLTVSRPRQKDSDVPGHRMAAQRGCDCPWPKAQERREHHGMAAPDEALSISEEAFLTVAWLCGRAHGRRGVMCI